MLVHSMKQLESSLARAHKVVTAKSGELADVTARCSSLDDAMRLLGSSLLAQVEALLTRLRMQSTSGADKLSSSAAARRMQVSSISISISIHVSHTKHTHVYLHTCVPIHVSPYMCFVCESGVATSSNQVCLTQSWACTHTTPRHARCRCKGSSL